MDMDHRCLVLSGRLLDGQDPAIVHARLAAAFGLEMSGLRERVFERAPLIIRRGLDPAAADAQVAQLRALGVEAESLPDSEALVWLRRGQQVRGPIPEAALTRYAQPGDQWCHDGGQQWFTWQPVAIEAPLPPPLAATVTATDQFTQATTTESSRQLPPPLPELEQQQDESSPLPPSSADEPAAAKGPLSRFAVAAALLGLLVMVWRSLAPLATLIALGALLFLYRRPLLRGRVYAVAALMLSATALFLWLAQPAPVATAAAHHYVARPLKPLAPSERAVAAEAPVPCKAQAVAPKNDEDRFLLTGQRVLTGRAQRKGDTYVAEAAVSVNGQCQPDALQLYVFRNGVFIGTALEAAASPATTKLADFDLVDDQHLRITLAQCTDKPGDCAVTTIRQIAVLPGASGWTLGELK
ncbi:hypothetical protein ISN76_17610 [Dyella halodurans]|uniref:Glycosyl hydrolase family 98 putative carbohydrate-binding module domain-containing protein n=1 Tax=Dyella halodurans TaxID=1920171 RepID=A0ABV9C7N5_9GAMM|nr:hypothetical protein [Dyella halodurans]